MICVKIVSTAFSRNKRKEFFIPFQEENQIHTKQTQ